MALRGLNGPPNGKPRPPLARFLIATFSSCSCPPDEVRPERSRLSSSANRLRDPVYVMN